MSEFPEEFFKVYENVNIGEGSLLEAPCIIGKPPRRKRPGELPTVIGKNAIIRPFTTIYAGNTIGDNFQTGQGVSIRENNIIGDEVSVGTNSVLEFGNDIGRGVRIHSGCFLEMVKIGNYVFIGPHTVFTDDPHPPCPRYKECLGGVIVEDLVKIGANVTILPGVRIGRGALVGAGTVVTENIPPGMVAVGNPVRIIKKTEDLKCFRNFFTAVYEWPPYNYKRKG